MEFKLHHLLYSLIFIALAISPSSSNKEVHVNVWPKPVKTSWSTPALAPLSPSFRIISPYKHKYLQSAVNRYKGLTGWERHEFIRAPYINSSDGTPVEFLSLDIEDPYSPLQHGVDETYSLRVNNDGTAHLKAMTVWGAIHGLETFSQLLHTVDQKLVIAANLYIQDHPLFPHRGVMLDTSRNYYPPDDIKRLIRAMSYNKLNVFHWHITDSHSFPIVLPSEPELARKGSYGPKMQYSPADVRAIVEYGMMRGVRVVPDY